MDPVASLRPVSVVVQIGDWEYTIAPRGAAEWIEAWMVGTVSAIVPDMLDIEDRLGLQRDWALGLVDTSEIQDAARLALGVAAGRNWWEAARLLASATDADAWPLLLGDMTRRGVDVKVLSLGAFLDAVWALALHNADEEKRHQVKFELTLPPPGVDLDELYDERAATADFDEDLQHLADDR